MRNFLPTLTLGALTGLAHADTPEQDDQQTVSPQAVLSLVASFGLEYEQWNQYNLGLTEGAPWSPRPISGGGVAGSRGPVGVDFTGDFVFSQERIGLRDLTGLLRYEHGKWFVYGGTAWSNEPAAPDSPVDAIFRLKLGGGFLLKDLNGLGALNLTLTATCALDRPWEYMGPDCLGARLGVEWRYDVTRSEGNDERIPQSPIPAEDSSVDVQLGSPTLFEPELKSAPNFRQPAFSSADLKHPKETQQAIIVQYDEGIKNSTDDREYGSVVKSYESETSSIRYLPVRTHYFAYLAYLQLGELNKAYQAFLYATARFEFISSLEDKPTEYKNINEDVAAVLRSRSSLDAFERENAYVSFPPSCLAKLSSLEAPFDPNARIAWEKIKESDEPYKGFFSVALAGALFNVSPYAENKSTQAFDCK